MQKEKNSRIFLAYDGSINADWVSRYAIRLAANSNHKKLFLFHFLDGSYSAEEMQIKIKAIADECAFQHVELGHAVLPVSGNIYKTILKSVPHGQDSFCVCGARITSRGKGFLSGTISEKLLHANKFNVLAIRVVHPGLLGCPKELLVPLVGKVRYNAFLPFYRLLAPDLEMVHFLRVIYANPWFQPYIARKKTKARKLKEYGLLKQMLGEMREKENSLLIPSDMRVVLSDDWVHETLAQASRLKARLVLLEAAGSGRFSRFIPPGKIERLLRNTTCDIGLFKTI